MKLQPLAALVNNFRRFSYEQEDTKCNGRKNHMGGKGLKSFGLKSFALGKIGKKLVAAMLCMAMVGSMGAVSAAEVEGVNSTTASSAKFSISRSEMSPEQRKRMDERLSGAESNDPVDDLDIGETVEVGKLGSDTMYVKIAEKSSVVTRSGLTSNSTAYVFQRKNMWGNLVDVFRMDLTCNWYDYGSESYISNLEGQYYAYDNSVTLSWDDGYQASPGYHALYMYAIYNGGRTDYIFDATCRTGSTPASISFSYMQY